MVKGLLVGSRSVNRIPVPDAKCVLKVKIYRQWVLTHILQEKKLKEVI